jgi:Ca2+-binding RTX toxin-like protein
MIAEECKRCGRWYPRKGHCEVCRKPSRRRWLPFTVALLLVATFALFGPAAAKPPHHWKAISSAFAEDGGPVLLKPSYCAGITVTFGSGNNTYNGDDNHDCADMGGGSDHFYGFGSADWTVGGPGVDYLYGYDGQDLIYGGKEGDHIEGGDGDDFLYAGCPGGCDQIGQNFSDELLGGNGDDHLAGANNWPTIFTPGAGFDVCYADRQLDSNYGACEEVHLG